MIPITEQILPNTISILVFDEIRVVEILKTTLWTFTLTDGVYYGYLYAAPEEFEDSLSRAYDILFEETLKRLDAKGVHLRL